MDRGSTDRVRKRRTRYDANLPIISITRFLLDCRETVQDLEYDAELSFMKLLLQCSDEGGVRRRSSFHK
jgi:hypothetical protein